MPESDLFPEFDRNEFRENAVLRSRWRETALEVSVNDSGPFVLGLLYELPVGRWLKDGEPHRRDVIGHRRNSHGPFF